MIGLRSTLIAGAAALLLGVLLLGQCQRARTAGMEAALGRNAAGAAIASGQDASNTVGSVSASEAATDATGRTNDAEIRKAQGAAQAVPAAVDTAGRNALCLRAAYRRDPRCLRQPAP
jgi:hypothetical protein